MNLRDISAGITLFMGEIGGAVGAEGGQSYAGVTASYGRASQ